MKKIILCIFFSVFFMAGCHKKEDVSSSPEASGVPTLKIYAYKSDADLPDAGLVVEQINDYIEPLIHAKIDITFVPYGSYFSQINRILGSNEQLDLFITVDGSEIRQLYENGDLASLNGLIENYAPDLFDIVGTAYMQGGFDPNTGEYYGVTTCHDYTCRTGLEYRRDIAQQYGIDMTQVHELSDLTEIFAQLKEKNPSLYPIASVSYYKNWDSLGDNLGVLLYDRMDTGVVNLYETPEYREYISLIREWYLNGYLYDTVTDPGSNAYYLRSDHIFSCFANAKPGFVEQEERYLNRSIGFAALEDDHISTDNISSWMWAVPKDSHYQKEAMQFLNLLYTDETVINLWIYGIEGIHYEMIDEGKNIAGFPDGIDFTNSGYPLFMGFACGNQYLSHIWEGEPENLWQEIRDFNDEAIRSKAFGFQYDDANVKTEVIACRAVAEKYEPGFLHGIYDIDTVLPQFIEELKLAGIDRIVQEKQSQLDKWLLKSKGGDV